MNHTNSLTRHSCWLALLGSMLVLVLCQTFPACKKVDERADLIGTQPYIATEIALNGLFNIQDYRYKQTFIVGDTATLVGRFFLDRPDTKITIGHIPVVIFLKRKISLNSINDKTGKPDSLDVCRFLITKAMAGQNLPLTLTANGYTVQGSPVTVLLINSSGRKTDTTLVVDRLAAWLPANFSAFQSLNAPFVNNCSVAGDGTIYFDNLNGIFRLAGGQASPVLAPGNTLTDQAQHTFTISVIISSVITLDGNTLYFSSIDTENVAPAADTLFITRLCAMNMQTQMVTTLNRTTVFKGNGTYVENPAPYNGNIGALKIVGHNLHADLNGNIFFTNYYYPENSLNNSNGTTNWYNYLIQANSVHDLGNINGALTNICKLDNAGQVTSLAQTSLLAAGVPVLYVTPGPMLSDVSDYDFLMSLDGNLIYGMTSFNYDLNQYDQTQQDIENTYASTDPNYLFISYDTAAATKWQSPILPGPFVSNSGEFYNYLMLPNNDILFSMNYNSLYTHSLFAYNMSNKSAYCYAGVENMMDASVQTSDTGNAKFVNFQGTNLRFCGLDRQGAVYYCIGGYNDAGAINDYVNGVKFYKLHRKGT